MSDTYARLAAEFDETFTDVRGGVNLTYITGEQVASRLNEVLGPGGWSFRVLEHGLDKEADEYWTLGELTARIDGETVQRQQFGSQKVKRSRSSGQALDIGFDLKGAATDALKKCASLIGVGLYLSKKESVQGNASARSSFARTTPAVSSPASGTATAASGTRGTSAPADAAVICADCGGELRETRFRDGTIWSPAQLAGYGQRRHGRALCMDCYRAAAEARKRASFALSA